MTDLRSACGVVVFSPLRLLVESLAAELRRAGFAAVWEARHSLDKALEASGGLRELVLVYDASTSARLDELAVVVAAERVRHLVVCGLDGSAPNLLRCAGLGVPGLLRQDASIEQLLAAIDAVSQGGVFMSPPLHDALVRAAQGTVTTGRAGTLTPREREVAALMAAGMSNKQIANALHAGQGTVKTHVRHVMAKLEVRSRADVRMTLDRWNGIAAMPADQQSEHAASGSGGEGHQK